MRISRYLFATKFIIFIAFAPKIGWFSVPPSHLQIRIIPYVCVCHLFSPHIDTNILKSFFSNHHFLSDTIIIIITMTACMERIALLKSGPWHPER